jgi:hypothetical protein
MKNIDDTQPQSQPVVEENGRRRMSPFGHLFRFIGWWFGFTGLYAMFAVCPLCGQQGCPVGLASAGTIGGFLSLSLSLCVQDWKRFFAFIMHKLGKRKNHERF